MSLSCRFGEVNTGISYIKDIFTCHSRENGNPEVN
jgi:hypothetical protein